jgi:hypothetical protein
MSFDMCGSLCPEAPARPRLAGLSSFPDAAVRRPSGGSSRLVRAGGSVLAGKAANAAASFRGRAGPRTDRSRRLAPGSAAGRAIGGITVLRSSVIDVREFVLKHESREHGVPNVRVLLAGQQRVIAWWACACGPSREFGVFRWWFFSRDLPVRAQGEPWPVVAVGSGRLRCCGPGLRDKRACSLAPVGSGTIP